MAETTTETSNPETQMITNGQRPVIASPERSPNRTPPATGTGKNMADTEVKASPSLGANEPPSPQPPAAPASPLPDAPPRIDHVQALPTPSSAYQAIAELNRGFEQHTHNLNALHRFNFFPEELLIAWGNMLHKLQAEASRRLIDIIHDRLMNNALYYDRLCWTRERHLEDPDDVLFEAERRKRELERERRASDQGPEGDV